MKEFDSNKKDRISRTLESNPSVKRQAPLDVILRKISKKEIDSESESYGGIIQNKLNNETVLQRLLVKGYNNNRNMNLRFYSDTEATAAETAETGKVLKKDDPLTEQVKKETSKKEIKWEDICEIYRSYFSRDEKYENLDQFLRILQYDYDMRNNKVQKDWTTESGWKSRASKKEVPESTKPVKRKGRDATRQTNTKTASSPQMGKGENPDQTTEYVHIYRTMPWDEYKSLSVNEDALKGHLGDLKEALNYFYGQSKDEKGKYKCLVLFKLKVSQINQLFKEAGLPANPTGVLQSIKLALDYESGSEVQHPIASISEGSVKSGDVGLKSEDHGEGKYSIAICKSGKASQQFMKRVDQMQLIGINFVGNITWFKPLAGDPLFDKDKESAYLPQLDQKAKDISEGRNPTKSEDPVLPEKFPISADTIKEVLATEGSPLTASKSEKDVQAQLDGMLTTVKKPFIIKIIKYLKSAKPLEKDDRVEKTMDPEEALRIVDSPSSSGSSTSEMKKITEFDKDFWNIQRNGGGGNCLFYALNGDSNEEKADVLRQSIVAHEEQNQPLSNKIADHNLANLLRMSPNKYLKKLGKISEKVQDIPNGAYYDLMRLNGAWGGPSEIDAYTGLNPSVTVYVVEQTTRSITMSQGGRTSSSNLNVLIEALSSGDTNTIAIYKSTNHYERILSLKK